MTRLGLAALVAVAGVLCGCKPVCVSACERARPHLIERLGVSPARIDCDDSVWHEAESTAACEVLFQREFHVLVLLLDDETTCSDDLSDF